MSLSPLADRKAGTWMCAGLLKVTQEFCGSTRTPLFAGHAFFQLIQLRIETTDFEKQFFSRLILILNVLKYYSK